MDLRLLPLLLKNPVIPTTALSLSSASVLAGSESYVAKIGDAPMNVFWSNHDNNATCRSYLMAELRNNYSETEFAATKRDVMISTVLLDCWLSGSTRRSKSK